MNSHSAGIDHSVDTFTASRVTTVKPPPPDLPAALTFRNPSVAALPPPPPPAAISPGTLVVGAVHTDASYCEVWLDSDLENEGDTAVTVADEYEDTPMIEVGEIGDIEVKMEFLELHSVCAADMMRVVDSCRSPSSDYSVYSPIIVPRRKLGAGVVGDDVKTTGAKTRDACEISPQPSSIAIRPSPSITFASLVDAKANLKPLPRPAAKTKTEDGVEDTVPGPSGFSSTNKKLDVTKLTSYFADLIEKHGGEGVSRVPSKEPPNHCRTSDLKVHRMVERARDMAANCSDSEDER